MSNALWDLLNSNNQEEMTTEEYLEQYGLTMQMMRDFLWDNLLDNTAFVYGIFKAAGITNSMIADILQDDLPGLTAEIVEDFFDFLEFDGSALNTSSGNGTCTNSGDDDTPGSGDDDTPGSGDDDTPGSRQALEDNGEFQVNEKTNLYQSDIDVETLSNGGFVVTWTSSDKSGDDTDDKHIAASIYDKWGNETVSEFTVNSITEGNQSSSSVATLSNGDFVVTWTSDSPTTGNDIIDNNGKYIAAQLYKQDGTTIGDEFQVNTEIDSTQQTPSVAALADGGFVVTWQSYDISGENISDGELSHIAAQIFDNDGNTVGNEIQVNTSDEGNQKVPQVVALNNGNFIVVWESDDDTMTDTSESHIAAQIIDKNGDKVGNEIIVNSQYENKQSSPSVDVLNNGKIVITWQSYDENTPGTDSSYSHIAATILNQSGTVDKSEFQVNTAIAYNQSVPSVKALSDGGFVIAWSSEDTVTQISGYDDNSRTHISAQFFDQNGDTEGVEIQVNSEIDSYQTSPMMVELDYNSSTDANHLLYLWESYDKNYDSFNNRTDTSYNHIAAEYYEIA